ncbi:MAG: polysaccharide deacetylase family protein [Actinobacteria bacterium]|nr:polysaccharide deacetylase family protein [Actinomycetota bacterium]
MSTPSTSPLVPRRLRPRRPVSPERRRQIQRRRLVAVGILVIGVFLIARAIDAVFGGGSSHHTHAAATRPPIVSLEAEVQATLRRQAAAQNVGIDRVLAYTPFVTSGGGRRRQVALTFDDGPGPYTEGIVKILKKAHVPATFFEVGFLEPYFHAGTRAVARAGDVIGDHTEHHPPLAALPKTAQRDQIDSQLQWMQRLGVPPPRLFRPPYGSFNDTTMQLLQKRRMLMVLWSVDTQDYRTPGVATIVRRALAGAKPGGIILMHDGGGNRSQTAAALPTIIKKLRKRGFEFVTVPQMMADDPPPAGQPLPHYAGGG